MKGRKPKADAVRHEHVDAVVYDGGVRMPVAVEVNPALSLIWDECIAPVPAWKPQDVPLLVAWCQWYAILLKAGGNVVHDNGKVSTVFAKEGGDGAIPNPDIKNLEKATTMLMRLGDQLNLTPNGRMRAGLMDAMTKSTQADVIRKTQMDFDEFRKRLDA